MKPPTKLMSVLEIAKRAHVDPVVITMVASRVRQRYVIRGRYPVYTPDEALVLMEAALAWKERKTVKDLRAAWKEARKRTIARQDKASLMKSSGYSWRQIARHLRTTPQAAARMSAASRRRYAASS